MLANCFPLVIEDAKPLETGESVELQPMAGTIALDGEREIELRGKEKVTVTLSPVGPRVVDIDQAIAAATKAGLFRR